MMSVIKDISDAFNVNGCDITQKCSILKFSCSITESDYLGLMPVPGSIFLVMKTQIFMSK